jgi:glutamine synthetase
MTKYKLEYIWLDGYTPTPNLRGKTQIKEFDAFPTLEQLPLWGFDGSRPCRPKATAPIAC